MVLQQDRYSTSVPQLSFSSTAASPRTPARASCTQPSGYNAENSTHHVFRLCSTAFELSRLHHRVRLAWERTEQHGFIATVYRVKHAPGNTSSATTPMLAFAAAPRVIISRSGLCSTGLDTMHVGNKLGATRNICIVSRSPHHDRRLSLSRIRVTTIRRQFAVDAFGRNRTRNVRSIGA